MNTSFTVSDPFSDCLYVKATLAAVVVVADQIGAQFIVEVDDGDADKPVQHFHKYFGEWLPIPRLAWGKGEPFIRGFKYGEGWRKLGQTRPCEADYLGNPYEKGNPANREWRQGFDAAFQ
ncbi:MAG: hypothetical protein PHD37_06460 [Gallionellaceae bacterium]|nr:hypothetical protein [Gallionellaceae bacterium]